MAKKLPTFEKNQVPQHLRANRSAFTRWFGKTFLRVFGWRVEGSITNAERVLITAAPHTSNWMRCWVLPLCWASMFVYIFWENIQSLCRA